MKINVFAKNRKTEDGKKFKTYFTRDNNGKSLSINFTSKSNGKPDGCVIIEVNENDCFIVNKDGYEKLVIDGKYKVLGEIEFEKPDFSRFN